MPEQTFIILHGLDGSPQGHWQPWLANALEKDGQRVIAPEFPNPNRPDLVEWILRLHDQLVQTGPGATIIAHSLGAYLWLHYASRQGAIPARRVLLVAPPGIPEVRRSRRIVHGFQTPLSAPRIRSAGREILLVGTHRDPYCRRGFVETYAQPLQLPFIPLEDTAGHINLDSGFGPWPFALDWALDRVYDNGSALAVRAAA
jgi:predicted alpha/beta hydrolase family esterase